MMTAPAVTELESVLPPTVMLFATPKADPPKLLIFE